MKTIDRIKKECETKKLNFEDVMYNCGFNISSLRYIKGKLYGTKMFFGGKPCFEKFCRKEIILEDCV